MPTQPVDIVNRALAECGLDEIGDLRDGSDAARAAIRVYEPLMRQLLAAANWNFARKQISLVLLSDVSGQQVLQTYTPVPWSYAYDWPTDCVHARYVPRMDPTGTVGWNAPTPFIVASLPVPNDVNSGWDKIEGHDPEQTRVILTNQANATLIYTGLMQYPDAWDPLFLDTMVAVLAARLAMPLVEDKKLARVVRSDNITIAKQALDMARVRDGDEGWTVQNHTPDWIRARTNSGWYGGSGILFNSWANMPMVDDAGGVF